MEGVGFFVGASLLAIGGLGDHWPSLAGKLLQRQHGIAERWAKKGPLLAALLGLAGLVGLQHLLVYQQLG